MWLWTAQCECDYIIDHILGSVAEDADSDEEWPALEEAGAGGGDVECDKEVVVDPEDEKAIEMFMNKNPPMRQDTTQSWLYFETRFGDRPRFWVQFLMLSFVLFWWFL